MEEDKNETTKATKETREERIKKEANVQTNKKSKKKLFIAISIIIIFLMFFSTIFALININNERVISGVHIEEYNASNLSKEELSKKISEKVNNINEIELTTGETSNIVKLEDLGIKIDEEMTIKEALEVGRTNNIIIDNYRILKSYIFKTNIDIDIKIDEEKFKEMIVNIQVEIPNSVKEYSYEINGNELIIRKGKEGTSIQIDEMQDRIIENIKKQFNGAKEKIEIPLENKEPEDIDIDKIYNEIYKEAKDASIVEEPFQINKEEDGIDFSISIDEAKEILKEAKEEYSIPLKITKPNVTINDLGDKLFAETLAKFTTIYDAGNKNRGSNISLAASTINETILLPGETFSYNSVIGNTTAEKGYKLGGAYVGGKVVQAYGGGICQVSSTLYNAALYANLEIVERYNHSYAVSYVPAGRDATVSYGGKDFKFKNNREYPIKISANAKNGVVSISILGRKQEQEYEIELASTTLSTTPCETTYEYTSELAEGQEKVIQAGHNGLSSVAYKIIKNNGVTISKAELSRDTYKPMNRIVQVGTKKEEITTQAETINIEESEQVLEQRIQEEATQE